LPLHLFAIYFIRLSLLFYNIFLLLYKAGIAIASLWNSKARLWIGGRKNIFSKLNAELKNNKSQLTWVHCSSLGEFEQGRPVIEKLRSNYPGAKILLTFFSPSGYEIRKNYKEADWVFYLPLDSAKNAKRFLELVSPSLVVFVKYDYWYYYFNECKKRNIPLLMISAIFRNDQPFFTWYGGLHRKMLGCVTHFFVQDQESSHLLASGNITNNVIVSGDTRFDRVSEIAANFKSIDEIEKYCDRATILVAGSTWPSDEKIIKQAINNLPGLKVIIAPHEIHAAHLQQVRSFFPEAMLFSTLVPGNSPLVAGSKPPATSNVLIIDNIGMLSRLYRYATVAYIGGGFDKGINNTLEAAVFGKPVLFGPNYKKFKEAIGLIERGAGITVNDADDLASSLKRLLTDQNELSARSKSAFDFVKENNGATEKIMNYIEEKRLLTR
jgi:3-deoxy-D-manno-octulosonic-acid transferase